MTYRQLEDICHQTIELAKKTGAFIREQASAVSETDIIEKGPNNFVTFVDKQSELKLVEGLMKILPGSGILAEENVANTDLKEYMWIIDPLDGTTNFIHSIPIFCISIALIRGNETLMGVVNEINSGECFYAWKESKAYLNSGEIQVSRISEMHQALIATGFPYYDFSRLQPYIDLFSYLMQNAMGIRRLGSAALDLAYVACGRFESFYEYGLHPWDVAAGAFIVQQAGGRVCDFKRQDNYIYGKEIVSTNLALFDEFMLVMKRFFN